MNDFTWVFHAGDGRGRVLRFLVERYAHDLEPLLPHVESDDPLVRLDAELRAESVCAETIAEEPGFHLRMHVFHAFFYEEFSFFGGSINLFQFG